MKNDLVLICESMDNFRENLKWKKMFEIKGLNVNLKKTTEIVSDLKEEILWNKIYP